MQGWRRATGLAISIGVFALAIAFRAWLFEGNLHPVIAGEIYRAAQPTPERLAGWIDSLGLRSVLNLKGRAEEGERPEGVTWHSVRMSARRLPSPGEVERVIGVLDEAPRPLLIHCHGGTDRSGLASAVALLLEGGSLDEAAAQFALAYGYPGRTLGSPLPDFLDRYRAWLSDAGATHAPERFRDWVSHAYVVDYYRAELAIDAPDEALHAGQPFALSVAITNRSDEAIPMRCDEGTGVRLSLRVDAQNGISPPPNVPGDRRFCQRDRALAPGETMHIEAPGYRIGEAGRYVLLADLVDEDREHWFADMGSSPARLEVIVR